MFFVYVSIYLSIYFSLKKTSLLMANELDSDLEVSEFEPQWH